MMTQQRYQRLFSQCPGAWVGAWPTESYGGHITVDATRLLDAIRWLTQRRVKLAGSRMSPMEPGGVQLLLGDGVAKLAIGAMRRDRADAFADSLIGKGGAA